MAQVKVYAMRDRLEQVKPELSDTVHACLVEAFELPPEKKFQRFFSLEPTDFVYPDDRSKRYTILEVSMFEGRSVEAKKRLIRLLFERLETACGISSQDLEITLFETPKHNWGIRGLPGDELTLTYTVEVE